MIDSHAHLIWENFDLDRDEIIERAFNIGIKAFIHPCVELKDLPQMRGLQKKYNNLFICAGTHPCHANDFSKEEVEQVFKINKIDFIAIGETGLDYYHKDCMPEIQKKVFKEYCILAKELNLPLIIHCRDAFEDVLNIIKQTGVSKGVMHCYTGNAEYSAKFWELGFYTSFSGCLTFKNAKELREEAKKIPLERVLIETDCPFLAPQIYRGKRNEPAFLIEVNKTLAEIHNIDEKRCEEITEYNTKELFKI